MPSIKTISKDTDIDFDSSWNVLANALHEIHTKNASQLSFEELYRNAYKLVLKKKAEMLYDRVSQFEEAWLRDHVRARITNLVTPSINGDGAGQAEDRQSNERRIAGERFMKALKDSFEDHQLCMCMITDVLMYMVSSHSPTCSSDTMLIRKGSSLLSRTAETTDLCYLYGPVSNTCAADSVHRRIYPRCPYCFGERNSRHDSNGTRRGNR